MALTYELISSYTVGSGGSSTITFSSIPGTYTDLLIKISGRSDRGATFSDIRISFNGSPTGTSYSDKDLEGSGSSVSSQTTTSTDSIHIYQAIPGSSTTSNVFGNCDIYIPNYTSSNYKSVSIDSIMENNSSTSYMTLVAGLKSNTSTITSIVLTDPFSTFTQYSTAYLYGIKNS